MSDTVLYLIGHPHKLYKVGQSSNPRRRLTSIQTASPYELTLVTTVDMVEDGERGFNSAESGLHTYYRSCHIRGEWFELPESEVKALTELEVLHTNHLESVMFDLYGSPAKDDGETLRSYLRDVWVLEYQPDSDGQEGDR